MKSKDGVKKSSLESYTAGYKNRIPRVIERLESQLQKGTKPALIITESGSSTWGTVQLSDIDVKRMQKELLTIKSR